MQKLSIEKFYNLKITDLISNKINIRNSEKFAAIIGINPSNGAKSPVLWNKVYKKLKKNIKMHCFDVEPKNFIRLIQLLERDQNFIGGAITNPYKEKICSILKDNIDSSSKKIGAINCIYRKNKKLFGTNTDGKGALYSLEQLGYLKNKKFLIIGTGGTALTLSAYLQKYLKNKNDLGITGRNNKKLSIFQKKFNSKSINLNCIENHISNFDYIINCTDVGSSIKSFSLLNNEHFKLIKQGTKIFDVIYNPKKTPLLKLANKYKLKNTNGLIMNFQQAVFAFSITNKINKNKYNLITSLMS